MAMRGGADRGGAGGHEKNLEVLIAALADLNGLLTDREALLARLLVLLKRAVPFYSGSIQLLEEGSCRIVAYHGHLEASVVEGLRFRLDPLFPNHAVIAARAPVAYSDIRIPYPHFRDRQQEFSSGHIRSWLGAPLVVEGEPIGMIALDRNLVEPFSEEEIGLVRAFADNAAVAIRNAENYRRLREALAEKDALMREVHHRVKNSLQLVASLVSIEAARSSGEPERERLLGLLPRIDSIARTHELLHRQVEPGREIDLAAYLSEIAGEFEQAFAGPGTGLSLELDLESIPLDAARAVSLGLALSELLANARKYAFPGGRAGRLLLRLSRVGERVAEAAEAAQPTAPDAQRPYRPSAILLVEDDGVGFSAKEVRARGGFGLGFVEALGAQLGGAATVESGPDGTRWSLRFPL